MHVQKSVLTDLMGKLPHYCNLCYYLVLLTTVYIATIDDAAGVIQMLRGVFKVPPRESWTLNW